MYRDAFSRLHPFTFFSFFILLFAAGAFTFNPIIITLSLSGAALFALKLNGISVLKKSVFLIIPIILAVSVNALFNHRGVTPVAELPSGNAVTLEAVLYGCASAVMICSLMIWLYCFGKLYSSDMLLDITGRIFPSLSLVISMTLRFIPLFVSRFHEIRDAQTQLGNSISKGSVFKRFKNLARIFSVLISRSLEESTAAADTMKSRGYGLSGRSSCRMFRFGKKDVILCVIFFLTGGAVLAGEIAGLGKYRYYPAFYLDTPDLYSVGMYICFGALCLMPTIYDILEDHKWKSSVSKI